MRKAARRSEKSTNPASQAPDGGVDQQAEEAIQSQEGSMTTQVGRRANYVIITNDQVSDLEPSHPEGDTASSSDQQAALEESNLSVEQRRCLASIRMCNAIKTVGPTNSTRPSFANASITDHQEGKLMGPSSLRRDQCQPKFPEG